MTTTRELQLTQSVFLVLLVSRSVTQATRHDASASLLAKLVSSKQLLAPLPRTVHVARALMAQRIRTTRVRALRWPMIAHSGATKPKGILSPMPALNVHLK